MGAHMMDLPQEDSPFVLDDRDTLRRLAEFRDYCEKIAFVDQKGGKTKKTWGDVMFAKTTAEDLVELLNKPSPPDGKLLPHQAFLLAFYKLLETPRQLLNTFPAAHRRLYYRQVLGLTERGMIPDQVMVSCRLTEDTPQLRLEKGVELDAGQDSEGTPKRYQLDAPVLANQGQWTDLLSVQKTAETAKAQIAAAKAEEAVKAAKVEADQQATGDKKVEADQQVQKAMVAAETAKVEADNKLAEAAKATSVRVLFNESAGIPWPERGVRLFEVPTEIDDPRARVIQGRVVSSPVLAMSGGERTVVVTFVSETAGATYTAQLSSEGKWLDPIEINSTRESSKETLTLKVPPEQGPITPAPGLDGYPTTGLMATAPLLKITRKDGKSVPKINSIKVDVKNLPNVLMSTDDGIAQINENSYPFGLQPREGSGFNLISPDWYANPFQINLKLTPRWTDLPGMSFKSWYKNYTNAPNDDKEFVVSSGLCSVSKLVLDDNDKKTKPALFKANAEANTRPTGVEISVTIPEQGMAQGGPIKPPGSLDPKDGPRWARIELGEKDFLHKEYPQELAKSQLDTKVTIEKNSGSGSGNETWTSTVAAPKQITPPYTPQLQALQVDYDCTDNGELLKGNQYLLTPFGYQREPASGEPDNDAQHPQLYLGFTGMLPGQDLSLHWQLQSPRPLEVQWQYLRKDNVWKSLNATVRDQTNGLFESGLWSSPLPHDASADAPWMPSGRYWIRGVVTLPSLEAGDSKEVSKQDHAASDYPWLFGLHTNSTTATLVDGSMLEAAHFERPLLAFTITQTVKNIPGLDEIIQPRPSYGGQGPESAPAFLKRVAKHLEHRGRALTWRDITALLREKYPEVYDVRIAKPVPDAAAPLENPIQRLVVIPANGKMDNADPLRPVFNPARLKRMKEFIRSIASPWLKLKLENPTYKEVKVIKGPDNVQSSDYPRIIYDVDFAAHVNADYAQNELQEALKHQYMPWGFDKTSVVKIGAQLDKFEMIKFIQQLDFVKQVNTLTIKESQKQKPEKEKEQDQTTVIGSSTEILILTFKE